MTMTMLSNILIGVGVIWIIGGYFSYMQTVKMNKLVTELGKKAERLYNGKNAGFMRTRRICFAAATSGGKVVEAKTLKTAIVFKPAKVVPFDEIKGANLNNLNPHSLGLEPVMEKALENLISDYKRRK